jgi:NAD(P)-dependent dehydrogenase (short-subunit alcohol dehydrogenase family)
MKLQNKVVVITGGSQGFGKALARCFLSEHATVVISSHDEPSLRQVANELGCDSYRADVTIANELHSLGEYVLNKYHAIDYWINNAGIQIAPSVVEDVDPEKIHRVFEINFFGYFYGCQVALRYMKKQGAGVILNINSTAGLDGKPELSAYSASKFAIKGLTESIRKEVKGSAIQVFGVFPGGMQTEIYKERYPDDLDQYMQVGPVAQKVLDNIQTPNPELDLVIKRPTV